MSIENKLFLQYFRKFLKSAYSIKGYNFRDHSIRKIKNDFRSKKINDNR